MAPRTPAEFARDVVSILQVEAYRTQAMANLIAAIGQRDTELLNSERNAVGGTC